MDMASWKMYDDRSYIANLQELETSWHIYIYICIYIFLHVHQKA